MEKKSYETPEVEVISFEDADVITTSGELRTPPMVVGSSSVY